MLGFNTLSDEKILERIQQGDEKILVYLYKKYRVMITNYVLKNNGTEDEAEELLQNTVIALWKNATKSTFLLSSKLSTYFMAIAKNLWYKELKKKSKFKQVTPDVLINKKGDDMKLGYDNNIIVQIIAELDDTCRKLLSYFYFDGLSNNVIAEKLGFANTNTVKSKKYQCFKKLQAKVTANYNKEDFF